LTDNKSHTKEKFLNRVKITAMATGLTAMSFLGTCKHEYKSQNTDKFSPKITAIDTISSDFMKNPEFYYEDEKDSLERYGIDTLNLSQHFVLDKELYLTAQESPEPLSDDSLSDFVETIKSDSIVFKGTKTEIDSLRNFFGFLAKYDNAKPLLNNANKNGLNVSYDNDSTSGNYGYHIGNSLKINKYSSSGSMFFSTAIHEMRHDVQRTIGASDETGLNPMQRLILNRSLEADACAYETQVAWEMKQKGFDEPWKAITESEYSETAKAYEAEVVKDSTAAKTGKAMYAAFNKWFEIDDIVMNYDFNEIIYMYDALYTADNVKKEFSGGSLTEKLESLGQINDSTNYLKQFGNDGKGNIFIPNMTRNNEIWAEMGLGKLINHVAGASKIKDNKTFENIKNQVMPNLIDIMQNSR